MKELSDGAKFGTLAGLVLWSTSREVRCWCILISHVLNFALLDVLVLTSEGQILRTFRNLEGLWRLYVCKVVGMGRKSQ